MARAIEEPSAEPDDTTETTRVEAFSDGVFAIAITLLILEIRVPEPEAVRAAGGFARALAALWPSYLGYVFSFVTIGIMWANHHAIFHYIRRSDRTFLMLNVLFLLCISFVPFPTAVLARYLDSPAERVPAVAFYSATMVGIALAFNLIWWYGVRDGRLLTAGTNHEGIRTISRRYRLGPLCYLATFGLAFVSVAASLSLHAALAILFVLPEVRRR
jgi:uncharacterized membrane protein